MEVIVAATYNAAELLDIQSDYGSIEEGKQVDFLYLIVTLLKT